MPLVSIAGRRQHVGCLEDSAARVHFEELDRGMSPADSKCHPVAVREAEGAPARQQVGPRSSARSGHSRGNGQCFEDRSLTLKL